MQPQKANLDPEGYYARLGVSPTASTEAIAAAFRRKARVVHPDVPGTGDTAAFVAIRRAHDVLTNPARRAAYDRSARQATRVTIEVGEIPPDPPQAMPDAPMRHPRLSDLPLALWVGAVLLIGLGVVEATMRLSAVVGPIARTPTRAAPPAADAGHMVYQPAQPVPMQLAGTPNYYIVPAAGPTVLWRHDTEHNRFVPAGQLPPFSSVQGLRLFRQNGLVEVRVTETTTGMVEASRLVPGDAAAARRAYCAYNAGPLPGNAEVLERRGRGDGTLTLTNRTTQPAVVKLRDTSGAVVAAVFLAPGGEADVTGLPDGQYRPDFAIGEMWSRACNGFAAGMRAQRFTGLAPLTTLNPLSIPPESTQGAAAEDISDQLFEGE